MTIQLLVECSREQQIDIENECVTKNCSISEYLMFLHESSKKPATEKTLGNVSNPIVNNENENVLVKKSKKKKSFLDND